MEEIRAIPGVQAATPKLSADQLAFNIYAGPGRRYRCVYLAAVSYTHLDVYKRQAGVLQEH